MNISRIIEQSGRKFYLKINENITERNDECFKIIVTDGTSVWESSKILMKDLLNLKPEGIDESIQSSSISLALFGNSSSNTSDLKSDDLIVDFSETSSGNLNISWKLKQIMGITILLGAILLLKVVDSSAKIIELLEESVEITDLRKKVDRLTEMNNKLMEEYEKVVNDKLECEEELYTKFRILYNKALDQN